MSIRIKQIKKGKLAQIKDENKIKKTSATIVIKRNN